MDNITNDIKYIGVNDHLIDLFEGLYVVPNGVSYNSYMIMDDKIAVLDTVDKRFCGDWLNNVKANLKDKQPDYLVIHHMEPDHSSSIECFMKNYPQTTIIASAQAFVMMKNFFGKDYLESGQIVKDGDSLNLGKHNLTFIAAPMIHWPEVMFSYDRLDKVLFSADAFGKFGALDVTEDWACEARRYYVNIVGKYGNQVQNILKKASELDINTICPLHGPILKENLDYYFNLYDIWSAYKTESAGIMIAYTSVYGNTKKAVDILAEKLQKVGQTVVLNDLARCDMAEAVEDAFRYGKLVLASTTYNMGVFPFMREFISHLVDLNFQNKKIAIIENGSWAPTVAKNTKNMLENSKNIEFVDPVITIKSALNEANLNQIDELVKVLCKEKV